MAKATGGGDFTPAPQGTHLALCNMVVDLGVQESTYKGETKNQHQVYVRWELPHERITWQDDSGEHEGPVVVGKIYTLSLHEKANLRKDLEAWRGRAFTAAELEGFDLFNLLGVACQITVTHKDREGGGVYANVTGVAGVPKGMDKPEGTEVPILKYTEGDEGDFENLPQWLRDKIMAQKKDTVNGSAPPAEDAPEFDDSIPF